MSLFSCLRRIFLGTVDIESASDIVPRTSIVEGSGTITINLARLNIPFTELPKVWIPPIPDTNSMDPSFDFGHNNILIAGADEENQKIMIAFLEVGDIAVYRHPSLYVIHRIVKIGYDNQGKYFKFKGDNNAATDPYKVREDMIEWLTIGTIF